MLNLHKTFLDNSNYIIGASAATGAYIGYRTYIDSISNPRKDIKIESFELTGSIIYGGLYGIVMAPLFPIVTPVYILSYGCLKLTNIN